MQSDNVYANVSEWYSSAAKSARLPQSKSIAQSFGYTEEQLSSAPEDSNLGLSCGNPLAITTLREGETVVDLGSGAGFDIFLAAAKVGAAGKAIGIDMNKDMLAKARKNLEASKKTNVEFVEAKITQIPLESGSVDCIISNCVVNLVPEDEKQQVFNEMSRLLKPGGRVALSDILARKPLSESIRRDMGLYVGCIAGASQISEYEEYLGKAGFTDVLITDAKADLNVYFEPGEGSCCGPKDDTESKGCCGAPVTELPEDLKGQDMNEWAGSFKIYAVKQ